MTNCAMCGRTKDFCTTCCHNYSDMYIYKDVANIDKSVEIKNTLYDISEITNINGKIPENKKYDWAINMWSEDVTSKIVIAFLRWNFHEESYGLESCGMRLCEYGSIELLHWISEKADELTEANINNKEYNLWQ